MNKKYQLVIAAVCLFFVIFAVSIFVQQKQPTSPGQKSRNSITVPVRTASAPSPIYAPPASTAHDATLQFYTFDTASKNPLANGAYKDNPYLSPDFKIIISQGYSNGDAPVFCPQNIRKNIIVWKEQTFYYDNDYMTQETISEMPPSTKDLYYVSLKNENGKWLIFDISCMP